MTTDLPPLLPLPLPPGRAHGGGGGKVRLVRCPRCHGLLPELPNVPLYRCGGCGATLRAKIRKEPPAGVEETTIPASIPDDQSNELENSTTSSPGAQLTSPSLDDVNLCLTETIRHHLESSEGCSPEEEEEEDQNTTAVSRRIVTAKDNTSSPDGQLDCRGRKQVSSEEEVDNNRCPSCPDAQLVSQGDNNIANSTTHRPDIVLSETGKETHREEVCPDILLGDSDRPSSQSDTDKLETTQVTDEERSSREESMHIPSSTEFSNNHEPEEEEEKPGARSFHAYDGSVSSYEESDDQVHQHQLIRKYTFEFEDTSGEQTRTDVSVNNETDTSVKLPLHSRKFRAMSLLNDNQATSNLENGADSNQEPPTDITNGTKAQEQLRAESFYTAQTSMQSQRMSEKDFYRKGPPADYENGGPSTSYGNNEFRYNSDSHNNKLQKAPFVEHSQEELLRKVDELRDQLCRSYAQKLETRNDKFLKGGTHQQENQRQMCSNHAPWRQKDPSCYRRNDPWRFPGACPPSNSVPFHGRDSSQMQIPVAADCRCHVEPEQFQYPLQQRPPIARSCYSQQICQIHPGYVCYHPCGSGPVIPSQFSNSNFAPRVCNSQPLAHGQRHIDHKVEKQTLYPHRDRRNHIKRHCLPVAGGAPIIMCYSCKKLLQLPADFILSSNRCSRLRCSSCSEVLIFQLQSGKSVPLRPSSLTVPPPSEVDNRSNSTSTRSLDFFVSKENRGRDESSVEETSRVSSRRILLEKPLHGKEVRRSLHRLMGYSSARRLIKGSDISLER